MSKITAAAISAESKLVNGSAGEINEKYSIKKLKKKKKIENFIRILVAA